MLDPRSAVCGQERVDLSGTVLGVGFDDGEGDVSAGALHDFGVHALVSHGDVLPEHGTEPESALPEVHKATEFTCLGTDREMIELLESGATHLVFRADGREIRGKGPVAAQQRMGDVAENRDRRVAATGITRPAHGTGTGSHRGGERRPDIPDPKGDVRDTVTVPLHIRLGHFALGGDESDVSLPKGQ